nr:hypothetical protein [uncultured Mediterranean phage uvMED]
MTAETKKIVMRDPSVFSVEKKKGSSYTLTSGAVSKLAGFDTTTTVSEVLDVLSEVVKAAEGTSPRVRAVKTKLN